MRWFFGCSDKTSADRSEPVQSIDAYVLSKHVLKNKPVTLFVEVFQDKGWSHRALLVSSDSLRVEWKDTQIEKMGSGIRTVYQYHLWGEKGSHIIDPISLHGAKGDQEEILAAPEIFVDVGGTKQKTELEGIARRTETSFPWYWIVTGIGGSLVGWYLLRRETLASHPPTPEERFRSDWGMFVQREEDPQERAVYLSSLLRRYLDTRFGTDIEHATPQEAQEIVQQASWPDPVREAVLRIFAETDSIRFAGKQASEETFAELGRSLEVICTVGNST